MNGAIYGNDHLIPEPTHYPLSLTRYGLNPYGKPKYRVVFAPSVKQLVGGEFPDGFCGYRARRAYPEVGDAWIIEKWKSSFDFTQMSEHDYNLKYLDVSTGLCLTGPYPTQGAYMICETLSCNPADANLDKLVALLDKAERNDARDNQRAILDGMERDEKVAEKMRFDRMKEALPAYGIRAANLGGHIKKTKSAPVVKSANELGLPVKTGPRKLRRSNDGTL